MASWLIVLLLMGVLTFGVKPVKGWGALQRFVVESVAPLQRAAFAVTDWLGSLVDGYVNLVHVRKENEELKERIDSLTYQLQELREEAEASKRLRKLLNFSKTVDYRLIPARVVGRDPSGWFKTLIIDKGEKEGVTKEMAVVNHEGVVGKTVSVSPHYAKVLLVIDQNSAIDALTQETRFKGILAGSYDKPCELKYITPLNQVNVGERVVTSGLGRIFPKGLLLGSIESIEAQPGEMFQRILVKTSVDFSRIEEVLIIATPEETRKEEP